LKVLGRAVLTLFFYIESFGSFFLFTFTSIGVRILVPQRRFPPFPFDLFSFFPYTLKENVVGVLSRSVWKFFSLSPRGIPSILFLETEKIVCLSAPFYKPRYESASHSRVEKPVV